MISNWTSNAAANVDNLSSYSGNDAHVLCLSEEMVNFEDIPLTVLRHKSRDLLSKRLNSVKVILSENGLPRDYRGILQCIGLNEFLPNVQAKPDPMKEVLDLWTNNHPTNATICQLQFILGNIDRWDVVDDANDVFVEDSRIYMNRQAKPLIKQYDVDVKQNYDSNILTTSDILLVEQGLPPATFDAFILFHDEDIEFATTLVEKLEGYGLRLFVKERDLLAGSLESDATMRMISDRCERLVVLFSNAFFSNQSNLDDFLLKYAQAISIEQRTRKIVPVCIDADCKMPKQFSMYFPLRYRQDRLYNFWEKLRSSIRVADVPRITITEADDTDLAPYKEQPTRHLQLIDKPVIEITKPDCMQPNVEMPKLSPSTLNRFKQLLLNGTMLKKNASISSSRWTISDQIYDKECEQHSTDHLLVNDCKRCKSSLSLNNTNTNLSTSPVKKSSSKISLSKYLSPKLSIKKKKKVVAESDSSIERESISSKKEPQKKWYHKRFRSKKSTKTKDAAMA